MKKITLNLCGLLFTVTTVFAQNKSYTDWQEKPVTHVVPQEYAGESAVIIEDNVKVEYKDGDDKQVWTYRTSHRIIKILDEKGMESFNKMNVPMYVGEVLETLKARTVLANGTIIDIPKEKMKESKGDDGNSEIVFAMDGVEKNAEVEVLVCYKKPAVFFGKETFQFGVPVVHCTFELFAPSRLKFEEKGYNGFPSANDTLIGTTRSLFAEGKNIPALQTEAYSFPDLNRMRAEYKASYMPERTDQSRIFTWQELAERIYTNTYKLSEKEDKAVKKYLEAIGVSKSDNEENTIVKIEQAIKTNITVYKVINEDDAENLENIITKKSATESGLIRLFAACFLRSGVKHELGISTNRSLNVFDNEFENWNSLESYLFYFPNQKKFMSPTSVYIRYPFTSTDVLNNKGLFCKLTTLGDITNAIADIRSIPAMAVTESQNNIVANISFTADMEATADVTYTFTGYCAMGLRELVVLLSKDKLKEMVQNIVTLADKPENILNYTITGEGFDNYYSNKPLQFVATVKTPQLVEKAGPKYLFRIGDVIGKQSELYQTTERKQPVDIEFPHYLKRTITLNIPDGYKILNPESIKIQKDYKNKTGNAGAAFYSDYKIEGSKLIVNISEFYSDLHYPISDYEAFRKVINASADFNKVTLLLAKI